MRPSSHIYYLLPACTGLLYFCCFPRLDQGYLAWIAFIPLLVYLDRRPNGLGALLGGFVVGATSTCGLMIWIPTVLSKYGGLSGTLSWLLYPLVVALQSVLPALACWTIWWIRRGLGRIALLAFPCVWVVADILKNYLFFGGLPWLLTGYSQTSYLTIAQITDLTGIAGVTFLIAGFNVSLLWILLSGVRKPSSYFPLALALLLIAAAHGYGVRSLRRWRIVAPAHRGILLQGNITFEEDDSSKVRKLTSGYGRMLDSAVGTGLKPDLVILPESPTPLTIQGDVEYRTQMQALARRASLGLILNNIRWSESAGSSIYFNSAYFINRDARIMGIYDKTHLVPFGEYVPLSKLLPFVETITKEVGEFTRGIAVEPVQMQGRVIGAIICFEAIFPEIARQEVKKGAELLVNLTNDQWYGDSSAPYQHFAMSRWRAIENRRYLLRAANSGISGVIDPAGRILNQTALLRDAVCEARFEFLSEMSFYSRYGEVFAFLCAIISVLLVASSAVRIRRSVHSSRLPEGENHAG